MNKRCMNSLKKGEEGKKMKNGMKKVGWLVVCLIVALLCVGIQLVCGVIGSTICSFMVVAREGAQLAEADLYAKVMDLYLSVAPYIVFIAQVVMLAVFGLWYYFAYARKEKGSTARKKLNLKDILSVLLIGFSADFLVVILVTIFGILFPEQVQEFAQMMENAGLGGNVLIATIASVVIAPMSEEFLCRGILMRLAGKVSPKFWIANIIQAACFGFIHLNLVQGAYAFVLGLLLGYLYYKYNNLLIAMLGHFAINFTGQFLANPILSPLPENIWSYLIVTVVATVLMVVGFKLIQDKKPEERMV